jgi:hypothetical protein
VFVSETSVPKQRNWRCPSMPAGMIDEDARARDCLGPEGNFYVCPTGNKKTPSGA